LFGVLAIVALAFALVTRSRFRGLEGPSEIVRRRFADHLEFWRTEILARDDEQPPNAAPRGVPSGERGRGRGRPPVSVAPPSADDDLEL
jgi:hypothetical protein